MQFTRVYFVSSIQDWIEEVHQMEVSGRFESFNGESDSRDYYNAADLLTAIKLAERLFQLHEFNRTCSTEYLPSNEDLGKFAKEYRSRERERERGRCRFV